MFSEIIIVILHKYESERVSIHLGVVDKVLELVVMISQESHILFLGFLININPEDIFIPFHVNSSIYTINNSIT